MELKKITLRRNHAPDSMAFQKGKGRESEGKKEMAERGKLGNEKEGERGRGRNREEGEIGKREKLGK